MFKVPPVRFSRVPPVVLPLRSSLRVPALFMEPVTFNVVVVPLPVSSISSRPPLWILVAPDMVTRPVEFCTNT